jgi:hypothetical protein
MGLMPEGAVNPFAKLDRQSVIGMFKSTGSRDPDVLHATKEHLLAQPKQLKLLGLILLVGGAAFTLTMFLALFGIPAMIFGWWLRRFSAGNIGAIEAAYTEYTGSAA